MKKTWKQMKRMLALFMALSIMVSTMNLPAWAADEEPLCGQEAHTHSEACYEDRLICDLEESDGEEAETNSGYTVDADTAAPEQGHTHGPECYERVLICDMDEHRHTKKCYVPAEVQDFLDAVAELPDAEDVFFLNAEQVGEQVNDVLDMYEGLIDAGLDERDDVAGALEIVYTVYEAVLAAEEIDGGSTFEVGTSSLVKSAFENARNLGQSDTCYGIIELGGEGSKSIIDSGTPNVWPTGNWEGAVDVTGYNWVHITNSNPNVATASYRYDGGKLYITFTPGKSGGTTKISVGVDAKYPHYSLGTWNMELNFDYTVTNQGDLNLVDPGDSFFDPTEDWFVIDLNPNATNTAWRTDKNGNILTYGNYNGYLYSHTTTYGYYVYPSRLYHIGTTIYHYPEEQGKYVADVDTVGVNTSWQEVLYTNQTKGIKFTVEGLNVGKADAVIIGTYDISSFGYYGVKWQHTIHIEVIDTSAPLEAPTITKTASTSEPTVGEEFVYTIHLTNPNREDLTGVSVSDVLDSKLTYVDASNGGSYDESSRTVSWSDLTIPALGNLNLRIKVKANTAGEIGNTATATWDGGSISGNTTVEAKNPDKTYTVTYTDDVPGKTVFPDQGYEGLKEGDATPEFVGDDPTSYTDDAGNTYTFQGWSPTVNPVVSADDADANGNIIYKATWQKQLKNLTVSKTPSEEYPVVGKEFYYTITVSNPNSKEIKVTITDQLNEKLTYVGAGDGGSYDETTRTVTWTDVTVPANGNKEVKVYVTANAVGEIYNEAKIECEVNETSGNTTVTAKNPDSTKRTFKVIYYNESGANWMPVEESAEAGFLNMPEWQLEENVTENPHNMTVSTNVPARDGYTFKHWQWGGDVNATVNPGDTITLTANPETLTEVAADLYAIWTKNPDQYSVTYTWSGLPEGHGQTLPTGGKYVEGTEVTVNDTYTNTTEVEVDGTTYVFSGWSTTDATINEGKFTMPDKNVTISGTWTTKAPETPNVTIDKTNDSLNGFQFDPESGNAVVTYTVTVTNNSGFSLYGLKLTDVMEQPKLTKKDGATGEPSVSLTFGNWQVKKTANGQFEAITPYTGDDDDLTHDLALLGRNDKFADEQVVTLKYTVTVKTNGVPAKIELDNEATAGYWQKSKSVPQKVAGFLRAVFAANNNDPFGGEEPDGTVSAGSSASGGTTGSSGSHTEGELPAKYKLTYSWNLPNGAEPAKTLPTEERTQNNGGMPAGAHFTVDTVNKAGDEVTVNGKTYVFSGWTVPSGIETETEEGQYKGQYVMPEHDVVIQGTWTEKAHTVTVRYMCDANGNSFTDTVVHSYTLAKGEHYDHSVDSSVTTYPSANGFNSTVKSPVWFKTSPTSANTWAYDEVLTTDALTGEMGDQDIVIEVWYSRDNKGNVQDGNDGPDGTPDKYQAKVVYTAGEGGSQNGVNTYATIMKAGKMATEGTISIAGATATPDENHYFVNWTAEATGHTGWSYGPSTDAELAGFNIDDAKGGAVYTFTANFAAKTALTIEIKGNTNTVTYNGNEQSVTGYTMTVKNASGEVIDLPAGLTVTPASADSVAKGTAASETPYPMGLTQSGFGVTGENAGKYTVTFAVTDGWLKINPPETVLDVTAGSVETTYDGQEHPVTPVVTVDGVTVNDATVTIVYKDAEGNVITGTPKDAGTYTAEITATKDGKSDSTTATVTINKRGYTVTTASDSKVYDGTALTNANATVTVEGGEVTGEHITATANGSRTDVGDASNPYTMNWGTAKESNYELRSETIGTLTVTKRTLTVTTDSASKTYDGTALTAPGRVDGLVDGETVTFTVTGTQTAVGNSRNGYTLTWDGTAKESNYTVTETIGTLTVTAVNNNDDDDDDDDDPDPVRPTEPTEPEPSPEPTVPEPVEPGPVVEPEPAPGPEVEDIADLPDDDVPLADLPKDPEEELEEFEELMDEDVPLASVPQTGDAMLAWASAAALSGLGLAFMSRKKKEEAN